MSDKTAAFELLASLKQQIEQDRIMTFDAIRHVRDRAKSDERQLSDDHYLRCAPIQKQIEAIERALFDVEARKNPPAIIVQESP